MPVGGQVDWVRHTDTSDIVEPHCYVVTTGEYI